VTIEAIDAGRTRMSISIDELPAVHRLMLRMCRKE
jgi:hypothetical protein